MFELLMLINTVRLQPLQSDPVLTERAEERAEFLCGNQQWSHDGWRDSFKDLPYKHYGENLARGFKNAKQTHKALMASPTHKANIVNKNYTKIGIGKEKCGKKTIVVQLFAG